MKTIQLSKGKETIVDDEDYDFLINYASWHCTGTGYARCSPTKNRRSTPMHRLIAERMGLDITDIQVDHINRNRLDNRRENLRATDDNHNNKSKSKRNTSGYIGVHFRKGRKDWEAYIQRKKRFLHLGTYRTAEEAAYAYNVAAAYLGVLGEMNDVPEVEGLKAKILQRIKTKMGIE